MLTASRPNSSGKRKANQVTLAYDKLVQPSGSGAETRFVLLVALVTILVCGSGIALRHPPATATDVPAWRADAFKDLRAEELATFNGLHSAVPEIELIHEDGASDWPSVDELADAYIPPFVRDAAWEKNGRLDWTRNVISTLEKHVVLYVGHPAEKGKSGSFLLVMQHDHGQREKGAGKAAHAPGEVWIHPSPVAGVPEIISDRALIGRGWREIVPRSGEAEVRRTKGEYVK